MTLDELKFDAQGLIPAVVQEADTGELLMVAWMDRAAVEATLSSGLTHFWSRSRGRRSSARPSKGSAASASSSRSTPGARRFRRAARSDGASTRTAGATRRAATRSTGRARRWGSAPAKFS